MPTTLWSKWTTQTVFAIKWTTQDSELVVVSAFFSRQSEPRKTRNLPEGKFLIYAAFAVIPSTLRLKWAMPTVFAIKWTTQDSEFAWGQIPHLRGVRRINQNKHMEVPWWVNSPGTSICLFCLAWLTLTRKKVPPHGIYPQNSTRRAPPGARTLDTLIKSQVLYQLS